MVTKETPEVPEVPMLVPEVPDVPLFTYDIAASSVGNGPFPATYATPN